MRKPGCSTVKHVLARGQSQDVIFAALIGSGAVVHHRRLVFGFDFGLGNRQTGGSWIVPKSSAPKPDADASRKRRICFGIECRVKITVCNVNTTVGRNSSPGRDRLQPVREAGVPHRRRLRSAVRHGRDRRAISTRPIPRWPSKPATDRRASSRSRSKTARRSMCSVPPTPSYPKKLAARAWRCRVRNLSTRSGTSWSGFRRLRRFS